ncbi:MAG: DUF808 domain-containing protein [Xanthomonadales bacterium]|nr:DUF808 domain-containing protein [Xanthomonadales bacterium]
MSLGLIALLDDVASLAKVAAASLDDIAAHTAKAGAKSAGVVIDDAAVTPRYVVGFAADRELPIVTKIARGSLFNKLIILLPAALALSWLAPWAITPLLMLGGLFLCYEGAEKVYELVSPHEAQAHEKKVLKPQTPEELEQKRVNGAIKTDFILSAEIMAIALATITAATFFAKAVILALVAVFITFGVYGAVALIVKADDIGVALASNDAPDLSGKASRAVGRGLVRGMPYFLSGLSVVGTAAMVWVGGGIVIHGLAAFGLHGPEHVLHAASVAVGQPTGPFAGFVEWLVTAAGSGLLGLILGFCLIPLVSRVIAPLWQAARKNA